MIDFSDPSFLPQASLAGSALATMEETSEPAASITREVRPGVTLHGQVHDTVSDRRVAERVALRRPLIAVPVLPDGSPDWDHRTLGVMVDANPKGAALELDRPSQLATTALVLLIADEQGANRCLGLEVMNNRLLKDGKLRVGGRFGGFADNLLHSDSLTPVFSPEKLDFTLRHPEEVLQKWAEAGVLQSVLLDRIQLCPKCHSMPTFRRGCKNCGSVHLKNDRLIHHFACAHVGPAADFDTPGGLRCPKCRINHLVVGADFDHLNGPYRCHSCQWSDAELEHVANCLKCQFRFPYSQAYERDIRGFSVQRMDPIELMPSKA